MSNDGSLLKHFEFNEPRSRGVTPSIGAPIVLPVSSMQPGDEVPLATIRLKNIRKNDRILLMGTVGWESNSFVTIEFIIHRGSITGPIVFSTRDSSAFITNQDITTSFMHAEIGSKHTEHYILTARRITGSGAVSVIGPIHFSGQVFDESD